MASWFSRLRRSSQRFFFTSSALRTSMSTKLARTQNTMNSESPKTPFLFWSSSLLPVALAVSAGSLALRPQSDPSLCEAPNANSRNEFVVKGLRKEVPQELIDELKDVCQDNMTMDYEERDNHGKPQSSFHRAVNIPDIVVFPRSEEQVSKIVRSCDKHKVPIVPYGGATSLEGHTLSPNGGVCIDMSLMNHVKALHIEDMDVVVEPGIGWMELNEYLAPYGLFFPLDPGLPQRTPRRPLRLGISVPASVLREWVEGERVWAAEARLRASGAFIWAFFSSKSRLREALPHTSRLAPRLGYPLNASATPPTF